VSFHHAYGLGFAVLANDVSEDIRHAQAS
jgi:hypothetical protein